MVSGKTGLCGKLLGADSRCGVPPQQNISLIKRKRIHFHLLNIGEESNKQEGDSVWPMAEKSSIYSYRLSQVRHDDCKWMHPFSALSAYQTISFKRSGKGGISDPARTWLRTIFNFSQIFTADIMCNTISFLKSGQYCNWKWLHGVQSVPWHTKCRDQICC